ncbi:ABC transporter ATP-binding protein [Tannockella kyphosi]|uniref:ABC transporter ATP-binding protein n=1 Tax=Tannockella kyphosi TaxID=2899121 RepID=UPI002011DE71|nr:ABC transporter ATP-binding protein [Tannockella kyphosi]
MIKIDSLTKQMDGKVILDDISLHIKKGSIYGIIGVNGAGKTTLIRHMVGSYEGTSGVVEMDGENIFHSIESKSKLVFIPDEFPEVFGNRVDDAMELYDSLYPTFDRERYALLMEKFGRSGKETIRHFSKGMKKQILFALALASKPEYLIMDEPFDGLDPQIRKIIWDILIEDVTNRGMTIFISSHHLSELDTMCNDIAFMHQGKILFEQSMDELKENYCKMQVVFDQAKEYYDVESTFEVLHHSAIGRIHTYVLKNHPELIENYMLQKEPIIFELVPVSLEEIFLHTLGGQEDEIKEITY